MRIFIAILLKQNQIDYISKVKKDMMKNGMAAKYVDDNNLHITLHYIGNADPMLIEQVKDSLSKIKLNPFTITLKNIDAFKKDKKKKIIYLSIKQSSQLIACQKVILDLLNDLGLSIEPYTYTPHITLARKAEIDQEVIQGLSYISNDMVVDQIHIMESKRLDGRLIYQSIGRVALK